MPRHHALLVAIAATGACHVGEQANDNVATSRNTIEASTDPTRTGPATRDRADAAVPPPVHLDPDAPPIAPDSSPQGAVRRALEYCDALATRRLADAYAMWGDGGRASGLTRGEFVENFATTRISDCQLGEPGEMQGAAGSVYIEVPTVMRGTNAAGRPVRIEGPIILKRVNDVPGSTAEQRRWHIARAEFPLP